MHCVIYDINNTCAGVKVKKIKLEKQKEFKEVLFKDKLIISPMEEILDDYSMSTPKL